jgi:DNA helicase-2/ATP-dependent DNA helicase PcrA
MLRCFELLSRNGSIREHYQERFKHILVDEFQDTNKLQYQWLKLLAGARNVLFAVGDDDQSIYAFRGAHVGNMQELTRDFHIESVIKLEQNYRSHGNILDAANALISNNNNRLGKNLWTSENGGEPLRIYEAPTDIEEARFVASEIQQLRREGVLLKEIALLYRSNAQSRVLEHALVSIGLSYRVYGGLRFYERQEIKHALAYLRLMENVDDDNALLRIINFPTRGIGARGLEQLQEFAKSNNSTLYDAAARAGGKIMAFVALIEALRTETQGLPLPEVIDHVLARSGLIAMYQNETGAKKREAEDRLANLNELVTAATLFVHENEDDSLTSFLTHATLEAGEHQAGDQEDALHLMTVHAAKGLEFHTVFITGLEEGLFPHQNSQREKGGLDEERRLMYVAITRARRRLYLCFAQSRMLHGQMGYSVASSFLNELPEKLLHWLSPKLAKRNPFENYGYTAPTQTTSFASSGSTSFGTSAVPRPASNSSGWRIGMSVTHAKFGEGVIVNLEGSGADARVQVNFRRAGVKWLVLEYAKLVAA